ncbi:MAG: ABC transporter ATP-binding protein [Desulforhabdus sp.]|jgi:ABC-type lipoprotein export system ATPase subunit|nr:ABC transporter ATP-binding protein [Desulforhabdus sp.]
MAYKSTSPIVIAKQLTRVYPMGAAEVVGISNIDLKIQRGELVVLKGNSGSGKSTLLALLAGLDRPTRGELTVADRNLQTASEPDLIHYRRDIVGVIFQSFNLLPTLNVLENICLPALLAGREHNKAQDRALELVDWLNLKARIEHRPAQLSGGEMQRTAIARSLINDPQIILADEPTGNLDTRNGRMVMELLAELNHQSDRTIIIATHSALADRLATSTIRLRDGAVVEIS